MEIDIVGFDGIYTINDKGEVFSYKYNRIRKLKPQKASQSKKGYYQVRLHSKDVNKKVDKRIYGKLYYIHRLVWETFVGEIPKDKQIDHKDGDTTNNSVDNLQLLSPRKNMEKYNNKVHGKSLRYRRDEMIELYKKLGSYELVGEAIGVSYQRVYRVIKDIIHYKDKNGDYKTRRYSDIDDEYTKYDRRMFNTAPQRRKNK